MTTLILTALILLLICTAAGLIFLVVTMSDQNEDDNMKKNKKLSEADAPEYEVKIPQAEIKPAPQKFNISKRSDIKPFSRSTIIVSNELKRDFEKTLAAMKPDIQKLEEPMPANNKPIIKEDEEEQEFIDVLDIMNNKHGSDNQNEQNGNASAALEEFLIGEQILKKH